MSDRKAVIKNADMSEEMQQDAVEYSILAIGKCNVEREIAALIKKEFQQLCVSWDQALHLPRVWSEYSSIQSYLQVTTAVVKDTDMSEEMQ
ncbi:dynein light chain 2, cytoplasmic-like [Phalacrocorax aristotelis]|uniref:dynein light chain 2, cytoplasmic-like n=1 Tax=Phalacrocorax aristotelis TaxID=126867 RepID=UPI003F4B28A2